MDPGDVFYSSHVTLKCNVLLRAKCILASKNNFIEEQDKNDAYINMT